jgi:hypothetical protein
LSKTLEKIGTWPTGGVLLWQEQIKTQKRSHFSDRSNLNPKREGYSATGDG